MTEQYSGSHTVTGMSAPQITESKQSVGELVKDVTDDVVKLMKQELQLAKVEMKDEVTQAAKAGGMLAGAGVAGHLFLVFASLALVWALDEIMHTAWAAFIVAALWGIAALIMFVTGRKRMAAVNLAPEETIQTLKEDVQWAQNRNS